MELRGLLLALGVAPYLCLACIDVWMHETKRRVPTMEKWLHLGIGVGVGGFLLFAFQGAHGWAIGFGVSGLAFMAVDEFGFHGALSKAERRLHAAAAAALAGFVGVWAWTDFIP